MTVLQLTMGGLTTVTEHSSIDEAADHMHLMGIENLDEFEIQDDVIMSKDEIEYYQISVL